MNDLHRILVVASTAALSLMGACSNEVVHEDVGRACLSGAVDQIHTVRVDFGICRSSSCDELLNSGCRAVLEGDTITVEASATIRPPRGVQACTDDCQSTTAECETPILPAGTYTVLYGDGSAPLVVPMTEESTCVDGG